MAKREYTEYTCDRCGARIKDKAFPLTKHSYLHVLRWFVPISCMYKLFYLCPDCKESFKRWTMKEDQFE